MRFILLLSALAITAASCNGPVKKEVPDATPTVAALPEEKKGYCQLYNHAVD